MARNNRANNVKAVFLFILSGVSGFSNSGAMFVYGEGSLPRISNLKCRKGRPNL